MDSSTYRYIMGQLSKSCSISHHLFPSHNLISQEILLKTSQDIDEPTNSTGSFLNNFPCYEPFGYDVNQSTALFCGSGTTDFATELVKRKTIWERQLKEIKVTNTKKALKYISTLKEDDTVKLPKDVREFVNYFHKDPELNFVGTYNWLYTGGNVAGIEEQNGLILCSPDYSYKKTGFSKCDGLKTLIWLWHLQFRRCFFKKICLKQFKQFNNLKIDLIADVLKLNSSFDKIENQSYNELTKNLPILQITCKKEREYMYVFVRQKNNVSLFKCNEKVEKLWRKKSLESKLLTFVDLNDHCKEALISDSNHVIHIFDVETRKKMYSYHGSRLKLIKSRDSWNQVVFSDNGIHMGFRNCFCIVDIRETNRKPSLVYDFSAAVNTCEEICSFTKSNCDPNYLYLGTTHSLLQMDIRVGKTVQKWTHLMNNSPQFMAGTKIENEEFLILQSQEIDEAIGIKNECIQNSEDVYFVSRSLPYLLNSVTNSLRLARLSGLCLNPAVPKRLEFAVTGIQCFKNDAGEIHFFTGNSAGDIFSNKIQKQGLDDKDEAKKNKAVILNSMKKYESHVEKLASKKNIKLRGQTVNMKHVLEMLKEPTEPKIYKKPEIDWGYGEMFAPESLMFYKDILAPRILKVWGFNLEEPELQEQTISSEDKVREWMEKF